MDSSLVSIVIPAYNREKVIERSIRSVLNQTYRNIEVIVVDDGSTDDTVRVVNEIGDERVKLLSSERNRGASAARNLGIAQAQGKWVAFQDSDDEWLPAKLQMQLQRIDEAPSVIGVYCGMIIIGGFEGINDGSPILRYVPNPKRGINLEGDLSRALLQGGSLISTQTFLGRRDLIVETGGFNESLKSLEDWDFFIRICRLGQVSFEPEPLVLQRFSENSLTRCRANRMLAQCAIVEGNLEQFEQMPAALTQRFLTIAGGYRQLGEPEAAWFWLKRALRKDYVNLRTWVSITATLVEHLRIIVKAFRSKLYKACG